VVTSIFVNPAQFGESEDFESYPRSPESDRQLLEKAGCDLVFAPDDQTMYPCGLNNAIRLAAPPDLATVLEGANRPGHFDGVVTVVARLFNLVCPNVAVFGEKDYQQLLVIRRMVEDLAYAIRILPVPTVREANGLAMSSRNNYLAPAQREAAAYLNVVLQEVVDRMHHEGGKPGLLEQQASSRLKKNGLRVDYVAIRCANNLAAPRTGDRELRVLAAVWCGETRLIDNLPIIEVGNHEF
jgi:pantoate--beta-alanine ligase